MKISTKLLLSMFVPALMALLVFVALIFSYQDIRTTQENGDAVRQIRSYITELNHIVFSYILYHEERPKQQFVEEHDALAKLITGTQLQNPEQQRLLDSIRENNENMEDLFHQLVSNYDSTAGTSELSGMNDGLVSLLLQQSYEADSDAALLRSQIDDGINANQTRTIGLIFLIMVLITIPLTILLFRMRRGITSSLSTLNEGTAIIGSGNLNYRIEARTKDEIGDLARSFNQMTSDLNGLTASKTDLELVNKELEKQIDERKKAEEKVQNLMSSVQQEKDRLLTLVNSIPDEIWFADTQKNFTLANPAALKEFGNDNSKEIGVENLARNLEIFRPDGTSRPVEEAPPLRALKGESIKNMEEVVRTPATGELRYRQVNAAPVKDGSGNIIGAVSVVRDITELKKIEESLRHHASELEAANKELEAFAYSVSHDLRQPLRALDGFSLAVVNNLGDKLDETNKDYLNRVRKASQTMGRLIDDLLKLSRITRAEMSNNRVDLSELATTIAEELKKNQPERQVKFIIAPELMVKGDQQLLNIALRNILDNAWKYTSKCPQTRIELGNIQQNGENVYFVRDNGAGFDMKYYDKLFQPFERLHTGSEYEGTGIGLATVSRIIRRHCGRVWAESAVEKGTTIYFTLEKG